MAGRFVWFVILLSGTPEGIATKDSGVHAAWTLDECMAKSQVFAMKHGVPIQLCTKISEEGYRIIASYPVTFDQTGKESPIVQSPEINDEVARLRKALAKIGKLHQGKTADSRRVRAIIRSVK